MKLVKKIGMYFHLNKLCHLSNCLFDYKSKCLVDLSLSTAWKELVSIFKLSSSVQFVKLIILVKLQLFVWAHRLWESVIDFWKFTSGEVPCVKLCVCEYAKCDWRFELFCVCIWLWELLKSNRRLLRS